MGRALLLAETDTEHQLLCTRSKQCLEAKFLPDLVGLRRDVLFVCMCEREICKINVTFLQPSRPIPAARAAQLPVPQAPPIIYFSSSCNKGSD